MSSLVIRFSTISPVANTSPVVSTAVMSMTTIIEMIAAIENFGMPKKNGVVRPNHEDWLTASKCASPRIQATPVPMTRPASTATVAMKPRKTRWMMTISARVPMAYARFLPLVGSIVGPAPPAASLAATGSRAMPMMSDDRARDDRREEPDQPAEVRGDEEGEQAGDDDRAVDDEQSLGAAAGGQADGDHRRDRGEGHALEQRELDADLPEAATTG